MSILMSRARVGKSGLLWGAWALRQARAAEVERRRQCPACGTGRLGLKLSKRGGFIGCSGYPSCRYIRPLVVGTDSDEEGGAGGVDVQRVLGEHPDTGAEVPSSPTTME